MPSAQKDPNRSPKLIQINIECSTPSWINIFIKTTNQQESPTAYESVQFQNQEEEFYCTLRNKKLHKTGPRNFQPQNLYYLLQFQATSKPCPNWWARSAIQTTCSYEQLGERYWIPKPLKSTKVNLHKRGYIIQIILLAMLNIQYWFWNKSIFAY